MRICTLGAAFLTGFTALLFFSCSSVQTDVEKGDRDQILHVGNYAEPQDLDPHVITGVTELNIISCLLEGLVSEDPKDLHPVPGVASSWESSLDGLNWTFHLRNSARWSNGDKVVAQDFIWSMQRILMPALASEYSYMLYCVLNAQAFNKGTIKDFSQVGCKAINDTTLKITLAQPTPYFLSLLSHNSWLPVHRATVEKFGTMDQRGTAWTRPENYVGNGPFILKSWEQNKVIVVAKSSTYWDKSTTRLAEIRFYPFESQQTEERAFRAGQLHVTYTVPLAKIPDYQQHNHGLIHIDPYLGTYYYILNVNRPPLTDVKVRKALAMSVDREAIVSILKGGQVAAHAFTPPGTAGYTCSSSIPYDTATARRLLAEAGFPDGKNFPAIELLYNTSEQHQIIAQAIAQMWKSVLNIDISLVNQEWKVYLNAQMHKDYSISRAGWIGDYVDPMNFLDMWVTGGGNNRTGWSNPAYDSLIGAAVKATDQKQRFELFGQAESILLDQASVIPIYFYTSLSLRSPSVKNWYPTILNHHPFKYIYLQR